MKLMDIFAAEAIVPQLTATTRDEAIEELVTALADSGSIPRRSVGDIVKAILSRENQATTGIGKGVALPHAKLAKIKKPVGAIGRSSEGVDFKALDSKPVHSIILMVSSTDDPDTHLAAMEAIFKHVQRDMFRKFLRQSETADAVIDLLQEADELA